MADTPFRSSVTHAALHILGYFRKEGVSHRCPVRFGGNEQEVTNSMSRTAAVLGQGKMSTKGYQKALRTIQCTMAMRESGHESHRLTEGILLAWPHSWHERHHSTLLEPGPNYKGLAARVLIHNASINTFIFLELHQGLEAEKTVTPNPNLAQRPHLWLFKSQHIPRTVNRTVLCLESRTPQKPKWNRQWGSSSTTKTLKLQLQRTANRSMMHSFCKDHQSTDLQVIIGTAWEVAISLCSAAMRLQMETLPSLGNNSFRKSRHIWSSPRSKQQEHLKITIYRQKLRRLREGYRGGKYILRLHNPEVR